jgi:hypothetical protein
MLTAAVIGGAVSLLAASSASADVFVGTNGPDTFLGT